MVLVKGSCACRYGEKGFRRGIKVVLKKNRVVTDQGFIFVGLGRVRFQKKRKMS